MWRLRMRWDASGGTRWWIRRSITGWVWPWRCAASRSRICRCATRVSTCLIAATICKEPMLNILRARISQGHRTVAYPRSEPILPDGFRGCPHREAGLCKTGCNACAEVCPTDCIRRTGRDGWQLDLGRCLFCGACAQACPAGALTFTREYRMAARNRDAPKADRDRVPPVEAL